MNEKCRQISLAPRIPLRAKAKEKGKEGSDRFGATSLGGGSPYGFSITAKDFLLRLGGRLRLGQLSQGTQAQKGGGGGG